LLRPHAEFVMLRTAARVYAYVKKKADRSARTKKIISTLGWGMSRRRTIFVKRVCLLVALLLNPKDNRCFVLSHSS
jgi:hypothetical protein